MKKTNIALIAGLFLFAACSNNTNTQDSEPMTEAVETPTAETTVTPAADESIITLHAGDDMKFDLSQIKVKEGQTVKITLNHTGTQPKTAMGHNFVLLAAGASMSDFTSKAIQAQDNDYIPADMAGSIIAHTKLLGGGESDTIEFTAPAKGKYTFLCSFPGHSALMRGTFIVE